MGSKKKNRNGNNGGAASPSNETESPRPETETPPPASPTDSAAPAVVEAAAPAATNAPQDDAPVAASAPADVAPAAEPTVAEVHEAPASAVDSKSEAPEASAAEPQTTAVTPHVESQPTQPPAEENTRTAANEPEHERRGARDEDAAAAVDAQPQTAPVSDATTQPQSEPANVDAHTEPVLQESDAPQAADPSSASEAAAPTTTEAAAVDATEPAMTVATADDKATPKRKRGGSKKRAGSKTPRSASKTPGTAKKTTGSASKTAKTPRSASKGKVGTPKKALAVAAAHIPKRALSFGRDRSVAEAPSPQAADTPSRSAEDAAASPVQDAASPQPVVRSDSALFGNSVNMSASFSRKPVLRLYGEAAEHAIDAKVRGPALRNVGWIYATGATDTVVKLDKAYAYFYHAGKDGDDGARFYMAQLQLGRKLSPDMLPWDPKSVGTDEAMSARRSRGRSASPRRGASPARGKSPGKASPARARRAATGPFGGLKKAIENLELCASGGSAEAMLELGYLHDPNMPAPVGFVEPAVDVAPTPTEKSSASLAKPAAADGAEAPPPILVRNEAVARVWYTKASELGNRTAAMRLEDLDEVAALLAAKQRRAGKAFTRDAGSSVAAAA